MDQADNTHKQSIKPIYDQLPIWFVPCLLTFVIEAWQGYINILPSSCKPYICFFFIFSRMERQHQASAWYSSSCRLSVVNHHPGSTLSILLYVECLCTYWLQFSLFLLLFNLTSFWLETQVKFFYEKKWKYVICDEYYCPSYVIMYLNYR